MVRPLLPLATLPQHLFSSPSHAIALIFVFIAIFSALTILTLLCASHNKFKQLKLWGSQTSKSSSNGKDKRVFPGFKGNIGASGKALLKMVSWQRVQDEGEAVESVDFDGDDEDAVWRKAIIMGERCRPLDFSGKIEYDCEGNPLPSDHGDEQRVVTIDDDRRKGAEIMNK